MLSFGLSILKANRVGTRSQDHYRAAHVCQCRHKAPAPEDIWNYLKYDLRLPVMALVSEMPVSIEFGRFSVLPHRRELLAGGRPIAVGERAFDVLMVLIEASGAVVSKDALMERVWPNRVIEENTLTAQISAVRKAFATNRDLIRTIAGRGYQFTGTIRTVSTSPDALPVAATPVPITASVLPAPLELIGRDAALVAVAGEVPKRRFVTLVGSGGIGKTSLAIAVAHRLEPDYADGARFVDLALLAGGQLVATTLASALGLSALAENATTTILSYLHNRRMLLILDNCEHVLDAAAELCEMLLPGADGVDVLATSRAPLRAQGEWVRRLPALEAPPEACSITGSEAMAYSAVRLFVERTQAATDSFVFTDAEAPAVAQICRRLDGIPLAIELAAAHVGLFGVADLATRLDNRLLILTRGRRTAAPRHRTLRAMLDWSFSVLSETEQKILARLSVFRGRFDLEGATAVAGDETVDSAAVVEGLADLADKSLVAIDAGGDRILFRLLESTRAYAHEKLGEPGSVRRRHAVYHSELLGEIGLDATARLPIEWLEAQSRRIDDIRAALDWAFGDDGDGALGAKLAAASAPIWMHLSLVDEYRRRLERALAWLKQAPDPQHEMRLKAALGVSIYYSHGPLPTMAAALKDALRLAQEQGDLPCQLNAIWGLLSWHNQRSDYRGSQPYLQELARLAAATQDPAATRIAERQDAIHLHQIGDQYGAERRYETLLRGMRNSPQAVRPSSYSFDESLSNRAIFARVLWLRGRAAAAQAALNECMVDALELGHAPTLCFILAFTACPLAVWSEDAVALRRHAELWLARATEYSLGFWAALARSVEGAHAARAQGPAAACAWFLSQQHALTDAHFDMFGTYCPQFVGDVALARAEAGVNGWCAAEILRGHGVLLLEQSKPDAARAEARFEAALKRAREQGAAAWELRAATSLAQLRRHQGRRKEAQIVLASTLERLPRDEDTNDLRAAAAVLRSL
jgi:predicted ATPase/DNA-binding winged helix-turn-helix (wHTH) protein